MSLPWRESRTERDRWRMIFGWGGRWVALKQEVDLPHRRLHLQDSPSVVEHFLQRDCFWPTFN